MGIPSENNILSVNASRIDSGLYLVSTPIGNLRDITLRALDILQSADVIYCEDTRVTGKLLNAYNIKKPLKVYNDHSGEHERKTIIKDINAGHAVALTSDAGTPLISDPGFKLVKDCLAQNIKIIPCPGANAILPAIQLSGFASHGFSFLGFLPRGEQSKKQELEVYAKQNFALVLYENNNRVAGTLETIRASLGNRHVAVVREITKLFETAHIGTASELLTYFEEHGPPKGEIVIVIAPAENDIWTEDAVKESLRKEMTTHSVKESVANVYVETGWKKKDVYNLALTLKDDV